MTEIVGIQVSTNLDTRDRYYTLHVLEDFSAYDTSRKQEKFCTGKKARVIYIGNYKNASSLKVGMSIEIYYGEAIPKKDGGFFSPIKKIQIISETSNNPSSSKN